MQHMCVNPYVHVPSGILGSYLLYLAANGRSSLSFGVCRGFLDNASESLKHICWSNLLAGVRYDITLLAMATPDSIQCQASTADITTPASSS